MQLSLNMKTSLSQTLTPQQIQYLKLLQLPLVQLEQHVRQEIEANPLLEEFDYEGYGADASDYAPETNQDFLYEAIPAEPKSEFYTNEHPAEPQSYIDDQADPFEFYKMIWQDDTDTPGSPKAAQNDDEFEPFQIKDTFSFLEELKKQLSLFNLTEEEMIIADLILGSINRAGYLVRDEHQKSPNKNDGYEYYPPDKYENMTIEEEITDRTNIEIDELNQKLKEAENKEIEKQKAIDESNPARKFAISAEAIQIVNKNKKDAIEYIFDDEEDGVIDEKSMFLQPVTIKDTERVIKIVQHLDPPGIASRNIRECLLAQLDVLPKKNAAQKLATEILLYSYEAFTMKHYQAILKQFEVTEEYLREALDEIRKLNPKPAGFDFAHEMNAVTPDFMIGKEEKTDELMIIVNDSRLPTLKVNDAYNKIRQDAKYKKTKKDEQETMLNNRTDAEKAEATESGAKPVNINREAINWIRTKYEDAKFLIQAIRQRKSTMLKVMTAIAFRQKDFFDVGAPGLKPLIYKDVSDDTGLDISTICRIVNGKYCQTEYGTFELRYFFSESLTNDDGEEVSTRVIKDILREAIEQESKDKPYSDEKLAEVLKEKGHNVARRTVAKYREQMNIPVARLRKEL